jgi:UDP-N-acetyl-D-mannosaminuronate dehydrogenase
LWAILQSALILEIRAYRRKNIKITSGSTLEVGLKINKLYQSVITAGTYLAPSIKVAEAAKVMRIHNAISI